MGVERHRKRMAKGKLPLATAPACDVRQGAGIAAPQPSTPRPQAAPP
jgi:hypothetical protein